MTDQGPNQMGDSPEVPPPPPASQPAEQFPREPMASGAGTPADLGARFLARLIDHVLLGIVIFAILVPLVIGAMFTDGSFNPLFGGFSGYGFVSALLGAIITIGYFAIMESRMGQTVGKMLLGLRTEAPNGGNPTMEQAFRRNAWYALGIVPFLGGLAQLAVVIYIAVTISNSPTRTGWHDTFAGGTRVVRTR